MKGSECGFQSFLLACVAGLRCIQGWRADTYGLISRRQTLFFPQLNSQQLCCQMLPRDVGLRRKKIIRKSKNKNVKIFLHRFWNTSFMFFPPLGTGQNGVGKMLCMLSFKLAFWGNGSWDLQRKSKACLDLSYGGRANPWSVGPKKNTFFFFYFDESWEMTRSYFGC